MDGFETTEERLKHYGFNDERIKIKHFPSREDYITYLKNGHVFLSCARSEGWNLPLIEAMACGTPSIYSAGSAQMEFASSKGLPVKIATHKPANVNSYARYTQSELPGEYPEPDFEDLARVMRDAFKNYTDHKKRAIEEAKLIHRDFNWNKVAEIGRDTLQDFMDNYVSPPIKPNEIIISYLEGPKVEILGDNDQKYFIEFIDGNTNQVIFSDNITNNMWTTCGRKYYIPWVIKVNGEIVDKLDLTDKRVLITLESNSLGDTIAWTPYAVEFAKKHNCKVIMSTFHNEWFKGLEAYKDIEFMELGSSTPCVAVYRIGWFKDDKGLWNNKEKHPNQVNLYPMQQTATDILGLDYKELNYGLNFQKGKRPLKGKYVVIGPHSTAGCKEWPHHNWITLVKLLNQSGYQVVTLTKHKLDIPGAINSWNQPFESVANYMLHADLFIGLSSGLAWFNWGLGKKTVMINGFTSAEHEFQSKVVRVRNESVCNSCWVNPNFSFDPGDWDWCPIWKGTDKQHICMKSVSPTQVYNKVKQILNSKK
jgi:autotransporter strand-loop-strand O-heptosyltransferase